MRAPRARRVGRHPNDGLEGHLGVVAAGGFVLGIGVASLVHGGPWTWLGTVGASLVVAVGLVAAAWSARAILNLFGTWDDEAGDGLQ